MGACAQQARRPDLGHTIARETFGLTYTQLRDRASVDAAALAVHDSSLDVPRAMQNAVLLGFRERELGIAADTGLNLARAIAAGHPRAGGRALIEILQATPHAPIVASAFPVAGALSTARRSALLATFDVEHSHADFNAYVGLVLRCDFGAGLRTADLSSQMRAARARFPDSAALMYRVALCSYRLRMDAADPAPAPLFERSFDEGLADAGYFLGELSLATGHLARAERLFQTLSTIDLWPGPWLGLAGIHMEFEEYETALDDLRMCLSSAPRQPEALSRKAKTLTALGRYAASLDALESLEATHEWSEVDIDLWRARDLRLLQRFAEADTVAATARKMAGAYVSADLAKESGLVLLGLERPADAAKWLSDAVELNDADCEAWENLGVAKESVGSLASASEAFARASACAVATADALRKRAASETDSDLTPARLTALRARLHDRAEGFDAMRFRTAFNAGRLLAAIGKNDDAVIWLQLAAQFPDTRGAALNLLRHIGGFLPRAEAAPPRN